MSEEKIWATTGAEVSRGFVNIIRKERGWRDRGRGFTVFGMCSVSSGEMGIIMTYKIRFPVKSLVLHNHWDYKFYKLSLDKHFVGLSWGSVKSEMLQQAQQLYEVCFRKLFNLLIAHAHSAEPPVYIHYTDMAKSSGAKDRDYSSPGKETVESRKAPT